MFMRRNRALNGAPQPESVAAASSAVQRKSRKLSPNLPLEPGAEDWRFQPNLESCEKINDHHYTAGLRDGGPYDRDYVDKVPFVGMPPNLADGRLLSDPNHKG